MSLESFLSGANAGFLEALWTQYKQSPDSVDPAWRTFFDQFDTTGEQVLRGTFVELPDAQAALLGDYSNAPTPQTQKKVGLVGKDARSDFPPNSVPTVTDCQVEQGQIDAMRISELVLAYRRFGHWEADVDPLTLRQRPKKSELSYEAYGFTQHDLDKEFVVGGVFGLEKTTLRHLIELLRKAYCSTLAAEFMHIPHPDMRAWVQERLERRAYVNDISPTCQREILSQLIYAEGFEKFCDIKYTGTKRFGVDGAEAMVPAINEIIKKASNLGVKEISIGMPHRGRLNVLVNVLKKPFKTVFYEFKGGSATPEDVGGSGDVKYHVGASVDRVFGDNTIHLSLASNPSHLEIVDPVVLGKARAKQDQHHDENRQLVIPLLIHGDASFAGQGIVAECLSLSELSGYRTGGSIHLIVNNQIGFTTSPIHARSSPYPSDMAKMVDSLIFHVNGDDVESVVFAAILAVEYRQIFHKPVVIDMFCYRRFGHNEADEPMFTQPTMYKKIKNHDTTLSLYASQLVEKGCVTAEEVESLKATCREELERHFEESTTFKPMRADWLDGKWYGLESSSTGSTAHVSTGVKKETLKRLGHKMTQVPENFHMHKTIARFLHKRAESIESEKNIDWATAEALAFATLLDENTFVRLSGQDSQRGTFSQRHAVLHDQELEDTLYIPLDQLKDDQARFEVLNSSLSENAVLGFEYGYSLAEPDALVLWEAQFGDFANGAQVVVDQFISASEHKWLRLSGLVMLLPHGYEGQGPEHSSARLERYLQLCAQNNMQVANCTRPANYFHILRRQVRRRFRKPLVIMTPKSLLRHPGCVSALSEFSEETHFRAILPDDADAAGLEKDDAIKRVILCSGKVYYDLYDARSKKGITNVYIVRLEQLYPFPDVCLLTMIQRFPHADFAWCQEEPKNQGSWFFVAPLMDELLEKAGYSERVHYVGRAASASTAAGLMRKHLQELDAFLEAAFHLK